MPVMSSANTAGICGAAVLTMEAMWPGRRTDSSGVSKAAETVPALPLTGSRVLPGAGTPTCQPLGAQGGGHLLHLGRRSGP